MEETAAAESSGSVQETVDFVEGAVNKALELLQEHWLNMVLAIAILVVGIWVAKGIAGLLKKGMKKRDIDPALTSFLSSLLYYGLLTAVVIAAIDRIGIPTTSFVAVLGAAGLAVGLALQGSLSNFASGTLIILFKPFRIGDVVEAAGVLGVVEDIGVLVTVLKTPDNRKVIAPNSAIMGGIITNITGNTERRIDMTWGVSYNDNLDGVKAAIMDELVKHPKVLKDPAPVVEIWEYADSSINFVVRPWVKTPDWWPVRCELMSSIKKRLDSEGFSIPFPQRDVHLFQQKD